MSADETIEAIRQKWAAPLDYVSPDWDESTFTKYHERSPMGLVTCSQPRRLWGMLTGRSAADTGRSCRTGIRGYGLSVSMSESGCSGEFP